MVKVFVLLALLTINILYISESHTANVDTQQAVLETEVYNFESKVETVLYVAGLCTTILAGWLFKATVDIKKSVVELQKTVEKKHEKLLDMITKEQNMLLMKLDAERFQRLQDKDNTKDLCYSVKDGIQVQNLQNQNTFISRIDFENIIEMKLEPISISLSNLNKKMENTDNEKF